MKQGADMEFARTDIGTSVRWNLTVRFFLAFEKPLQLSYGPAPAVLGDLTRIVQRIVLGIEAETARILANRS